MFKKSKIKIVAAIMSVLVILWVGTLGVIYGSSYFEVSKRNREMLKEHADMYTLSASDDDGADKNDDGNVPPEKPEPTDNGRKGGGFADSPMFQLSTFYTVAVSDSGEILEIKNDRPAVHSNSELQKTAQSIISEGKESGTVNNLAFYKADKGGYTLVAFMDNTVVNESATTLFRYTLIIGGIALVLFFFLAVFLAERIVGPLEQSYKKQKQFISDAGHELKTPVSVVGANVELLSREIGENQWLDNIRYENERMGALVAQLLQLARTENVTVQKEHIDFSRLVAGETLPFESVAFEKGLTLNSNIDENITVEGNSAQLKQVVSILLDNAMRHSAAPGEIKLSLTKEHGQAKLSVINRGEEIPKERRELIFERFYRIDTARSAEDNHYGLGLAIAKAITTAHKGNISVFCYDGLVEFRVKIPAE